MFWSSSLWQISTKPIAVRSTTFSPLMNSKYTGPTPTGILKNFLISRTAPLIDWSMRTWSYLVREKATDEWCAPQTKLQSLAPYPNLLHGLIEADGPRCRVCNCVCLCVNISVNIMPVENSSRAEERIVQKIRNNLENLNLFSHYLLPQLEVSYYLILTSWLFFAVVMRRQS